MPFQIVLTGLSATVCNIDISIHRSLLAAVSTQIVCRFLFIFLYDVECFLCSLLPQIFRMSMWNYTPVVMDALAELIVSLVS